MHRDLMCVPLSELNTLTSSWPSTVWGIKVIGKISPKSSNGHEFILIVIDYFTKWVKADSYAKLNLVKVSAFIKSHIIFLYRVPHELISYRGVYFRGEVESFL